MPDDIRNLPLVTLALTIRLPAFIASIEQRAIGAGKIDKWQPVGLYISPTNGFSLFASATCVAHATDFSDLVTQAEAWLTRDPVTEGYATLGLSSDGTRIVDTAKGEAL